MNKDEGTINNNKSSKSIINIFNAPVSNVSNHNQDLTGTKNRNIEVKEGNYNEHIQGDNIQGSYTTQNRKHKIKNPSLTLSNNSNSRKLFLVRSLIVIGSGSGVLFGVPTIKNYFNNSLPPEKPVIATSCPNVNINPKNNNDTTLISPATGVNYTKLRDLLAKSQWKEAEDETRQTMFQVAGTESLYESLEQFPYEDLSIIDQLWRQYSNGKFGFSVQVLIYEELGDWNEFGDEVGWRNKEGKWLYNNDLIYNLDKAPPGHLPRSLGKNMGGNKGRKALFDRVKACNLSSS